MKKIIFLLSLFLFPIFIFAGNKPGNISLTLSEGYYHFDTRRHLQNASVPNIAVAYNFTQQWAMEGSVGIANTNQSNGTHRGVNVYLYNLDAIYRFTPHKRWEPYVLFGVGESTFFPTNESTHQGNINAGIGTQFFAHDIIALRAEARDVYTMAGGKNDVLLNFGVSLLLG